MASSDATNSNRTRADSNSSQSGPPPTGPIKGKCVACRKTTKSKVFLTCTICDGEFHTLCLPDWTDIKQNSDIEFLNRPGLNWYCASCHPTLNEYVRGPLIEKSLNMLTSEIQDMKDMMHESVNSNKASFADAINDSKTVKAIATRLEKTINTSEAQSQKRYEEKEREDRCFNAILHLLPEENATHADIFQICEEMSFNPDAITKILRLGRRNMTLPPTEKMRPVKLTFNSMLHRNSFLTNYHYYENRGDTFVTPDHTKEELEKQYQLRQLKRLLSTENPSTTYQVRNGVLRMKARSANEWTVINPSDHAAPVSAPVTQST